MQFPWQASDGNPWTRPAYRAAMDDLRRTRLQQLVRHAAARVPYYARLFATAGVDPQSIYSEQDLSLIPITRKSEVQLLPLGATASTV